MKQFPSNLKFKKYQKINKSFFYLLNRKMFFPLAGQFALKSLEYGKINFKQIEACRKTIRRGLGKTGLYWVRLFTSVPVTKKPVAVRMGKGKGGITSWIAPVKSGQILFEISGSSDKKSMLVLKKAATKLPVKTVIIKNFF